MYYERMAEGKSIPRKDVSHISSWEAKLFPVLGFSLGKTSKEVGAILKSEFGISDVQEA